jgi:Putative endonuclease segE, GIY-YIG domain
MHLYLSQQIKYSMQWQYNNLPYTPSENAFGFIYIITNLLTNKKYIGKKQLISVITRTTTVLLKNGTKKKKRQKIKLPSDWENYYGSSKSLQSDIDKLGYANFKREVLYECSNKNELSYLEAKEQFLREVLERSDYYNGWIAVKVGRIK